jgi:hypothetical protein
VYKPPFSVWGFSTCINHLFRIWSFICVLNAFFALGVFYVCKRSFHDTQTWENLGTVYVNRIPFSNLVFYTRINSLFRFGVLLRVYTTFLEFGVFYVYKTPFSFWVFSTCVNGLFMTLQHDSKIYERTPKTKKAVYTRIKHPNRKWRFLYEENTQNKKGGLYTYTTPKSKMKFYVRGKHTQNENGGFYT